MDDYERIDWWGVEAISDEINRRLEKIQNLLIKSKPPGVSISTDELIKNHNNNGS